MAPLSLLTAFLLPFLLFVENISCMKPLCHNYERSALLQFNQSFSIDLSTSPDPSSYPKTSSWNNNDCCLWDGVECDKVSGHVIGLDLSSSYLHGSFDSNSSLFKLSHLERLNLADNHFNCSHIPSKISSLSNLSYLNLSFSVFCGEIPNEISELHNLTYLDLQGNLYPREDDSYHLSLVDFRKSFQNLTKLEALDLSDVDISSSLPDIFMNLLFLTSLSLRSCSMIGALPCSLGELTKIEYLDLSGNKFSGEIPSSFGELTELASLDLSSNNLAGDVPFWLENLTKLVKLDLSHNNFTSGGFSWLGKQTKLKYLLLQNVSLVGEIPFCLKNLTQLEHLSLQQNNLKGQIPPWLSNLTQLTVLRLHQNKLHGPIPESISQLVNLEDLSLGPNYLSGTVRFEMFSRMEHLWGLQLSSNSNFTLLVDDRINDTLSKLEAIVLGGCNLKKFPNFIRYQNHLSFLVLYNNNIEGLVPSWIGNVGKETLSILQLSNNYIRGLEQPLTFSLIKNLVYLDLSNNMLQGPPPPPPISIQYYFLENNNLTGEISSCFCNLKSMVFLDLSANNLSGKIPTCLGNSSDNLMILCLASNHLNGNIPDTFRNESKLRFITLSDNRLEGRIPRSLANCHMLQMLDLSQNQISDTFPVWLGTLPMLEVVVLRSNYIFGALQAVDKTSNFAKLRILDLSKNELTSTIPYGFLETFDNMKAFDSDQMAYMQGIVTGSVTNNNTLTVGWTSSLHLANKGMYMEYQKIPNVLAGLDFSSNKFQGDIPESIASLQMINILDFSNNQLSGQIPSFLRNLTKLESLDLSNNNFSGKIPQLLTELTFLEYFNVSNNQLTGSIPQRNQFGTFDNSSYQGNLGLCGFPLTNQCGNTKASPQLNDDGGSKLPIDVTWKTVAIGYGSGIMGGIVFGLVFYERHKNWVLYTFERWRKRRPRTTGRRVIC